MPSGDRNLPNVYRYIGTSYSKSLSKPFSLFPLFCVLMPREIAVLLFLGCTPAAALLLAPRAPVGVMRAPRVAMMAEPVDGPGVADLQINNYDQGDAAS